MARCVACGTENEEAAKECAKCGKPLKDGAGTEQTLGFIPPVQAEEETQADLEARLERGAVLVVRKGPDAGERFVLLKDETTLGRDPQSDIFLNDITVSRKHARVDRAGKGAVKIADVGSLNGTYVNGERVDETTLHSGDEIQIGKFKMVFLSQE